MTAGAFGSSHSHASQLICHRVWCGTLQGRATYRSEGASATACAKGREQSPQRPGWKERKVRCYWPCSADLWEDPLEDCWKQCCKQSVTLCDHPSDSAWAHQVSRPLSCDVLLGPTAVSEEWAEIPMAKHPTSLLVATPNISGQE